MRKAQSIETPHTEDPVMEELHAIREAIDQELEGLTPQEKVRRINSEARAFWRALGYQVVPAPRGTYRIAKGKKRPKR